MTPRGVRLAALAMWAHAALHLVVPLIMSAQRSLFVDQFRRLDPRDTSEFASAAVEHLLRASVVYHVVLASVFIVSAVFLVHGKRWARALLTIVVTLGAFGTAFSFSSPTPAPLLYKSLNVVSWLLAGGALASVWAPSSRAFLGGAHGRSG